MRSATALLLTAAILSGVTVAADDADADTVLAQHVYNTGGDGLYLHPISPSSGSSTSDLMMDGTELDLSCWANGDNVNGDSVWLYGTNATTGNTGFAADYYVDTNTTQGQEGSELAAQGLPQCTSTASGAPAAAVAWAQPYADNHDSSYNLLCLTFVGDAWSAAGVDYRSQISVEINADTYPDDVWGHFGAGTTGTDTNPPAGAWVFFTSTDRNREYSHVALSTGGGNLISTSDSLDDSGTHTETISQHSYAIYDGWWLPAS